MKKLDSRILDSIRGIWEKRVTMIFLIVLIPILLNFNTHIITDKTISINSYLIILSFIIDLFIGIMWFYTNKLPKRKEDDILIIAAINSDIEDEEENSLINEFISYLRKIMKSQEGYRYEIQSLSHYHAKKACKNVSSYHNKTKAPFIIYGTCKKRYNASKELYILYLYVSIVHDLLPQSIKQSVLAGMLRDFPDKILFPKLFEDGGFQVTLENMDFTSQYIMGLVCLNSYDPFTAFDFHYSIFGDSKKYHVNDQDLVITKIKEKLQNIIIIECTILMRYNFEKDGYDSLLSTIKHIDILLELNPADYEAHFMKGMYYFWVELNTDLAINELSRCDGWEDIRWLFGLAFLYAYKEDLDRANALYEEAFQGNDYPGIPLNETEFIHKILEMEPNKYQLWYCLGLIYYKYIEFFDYARECFVNFIEIAENEEKFTKYISITRKYLLNSNICKKNQ